MPYTIFSLIFPHVGKEKEKDGDSNKSICGLKETHCGRMEYKKLLYFSTDLFSLLK